MLSVEADHERVREGPLLAPEVADVLHLAAHLLADLARHGLLQRLADLHEAGQCAEERQRDCAPRARSASSPRRTSTITAGELRQGKAFADFPHLRDSALKMLDDLVWWTNTLRTGRAASSQT
jgi:hypothetical protein